MIRKIIVLFLLSINALLAQELTEDAQVSILTIGPGEDLYSSFGHSAIRIKDLNHDLDINYNYGTFDFRTDNFYIKFLRGQLPYLIAANPFSLEARYWVQENRSVTEQVLNLTLVQKQAIYDALKTNLLPENKEYSYKFFFDNCSSRLRDVVQNGTNNSVKFDRTIHADSSFREWIDVYAKKAGKSWADFGMDIAIGLPSDQKTGWSNAMFLPDNLHDAFNHATINNQAIVKRTQVIYQASPTEKSMANYPLLAFSGLAALVLAVSIFTKLNLSYFNGVWFFVLGLCGLIFTLLWFATNHGVTQYNMNLLWALPFWLLFAFIYKRHNWFTYLALALNLIFIIWGLLNLNKIHPASIAISVTSCILLTKELLAKKNSLIK